MRRRLVIVLVVVVVALASADLGTRWWLDARLAASLDQALERRAAGVRVDDVAVQGVPLLPRLLDGRVDVALDVVVPFAVLDARAGEAADRPVTWSSSGGQLVASAEVTRRGLDVPVAVAYDVGAAPDAVELTPVSVVAAGVQLPVDRLRAGLSERLGALLSPRTVPLDQLAPRSAVLTAARPTSDGLRLELSAHDVPLAGRPLS